jgi:hypothetical protein
MSRHAGFFASLQRVEDRLALEEEELGQRSSHTTTASSPLVLLDHPAAGGSGPALDFLTLTTTTTKPEHETADDGDEEAAADIDRLMALLGLSEPRAHDGGGFRAKVVGVVGPKCDGEERRLDAWIQHLYYSSKKEPARLAHLLLAKQADAFRFPATVKEFLDRDVPLPPTDCSFC